MEGTMIKITKELAAKLKEKKLTPRESYEEIIWRMIEAQKNGNLGQN